MGDAEKLAIKVATIAGGVILAGYVMNMFSDIQVLSDAKKGFGA